MSPLYTAVTSSGTRLVNSNTKPVFVQGAYREGPVYENRTIKTGITLYAGYGIQHDTGADGEDEWILMADKSAVCYGVLELDLGLISIMTTAYTAATDLVDAIPWRLNPCCVLQSVALANPAANIDADIAITSSSGTAGMFKAVTEATLLNSFTSTYCFQTGTLGTNAAAGTFVLPRVYGRTLYYKANPAADYRDLIYHMGGI